MAGWVLMLAAQAALSGASAGRDLRFDRVPLGVAAETILKRVADQPFVICDEVLKDTRAVSLRLAPYQLKRANLARVFQRYGFGLTDEGGVLTLCPVRGAGGYVSAGTPAGSPLVSQPSAMPSPSFTQAVPGGPVENLANPQAAPLSAPTREARRFEKVETVSYEPRFGDPKAIVEAVKLLVDGGRAVVVGGPGAVPQIVFQGDAEQVEAFRVLSASLDRSPVSLEVQAILVETTTSRTDNSGVSLVGSILKKTFGANIVGDTSANRLSVGVGPLDAILSAFAGDNRVRVISAPTVSGVAGEPMSIVVGDEAPTLSGIVENPLGSNRQSVQYRDTGVILDLLARASPDRVRLEVKQEVSNFAQTRFGVQGSPTISKRQVKTVLDLADGEWTALGGLRSSSDTNGRTRFLGLPIGKTAEANKSDLVVLLHVTRRSDPSAPTKEVRAERSASVQ